MQRGAPAQPGMPAQPGAPIQPPAPAKPMQQGEQPEVPFKGGPVERPQAERFPLKKEDEEEVPEMGITGQPPIPEGMPSQAWGEDKEKISEPSENTQGLGMQQPMPGNTPAPISQVTPPTPYSQLPPAVQKLFDQMVGQLMIANTRPGVTETTVTLNSASLQGTPFYGAKITIEEFSTAPKAFNVVLEGSPQAISLMSTHMGDLLSAFQSTHQNFNINRIDTRLAETPAEKKKAEEEGQGRGDEDATT